MVASTLPEREEFFAESVNNEGYQQRHSTMIFEDGFSFSGFERDKFWLRHGDAWADISGVSGADDWNDGRALITADFDFDGDQDLFVCNTQRERHRLYRNDAVADASARTVRLQLRATAGHASAIGARVRVSSGAVAQAQVLTAGAGYLSQNPSELVFALADPGSGGTVQVRWPGREEETFGPLEPGRYLLVEGSGEATALPSATFTFRDPSPPGLKRGTGETLTALRVRSLEDESSQSLADWPADRPTLVHFWATYCAVCVAELPQYQRLHEEGRAHVVLIALDPPDQHERVRSLLDQRSVTLPAYVYSDELIEELLDPERLPLPTTLVLDGSGRITEVVQAPIESWSGYVAAGGEP